MRCFSAAGGVRLATALVAVWLAACGGDGDRTGTVVGAMVRADLTLLRHRPALVAEKYRVMGASPYAFLRGSFPVFVRDALDPSMGLVPPEASLPDTLAFGVGDAHLENFGTLRASDGTFGLEVNDLDAADRYPFHWDSLRLLSSLVVAVRLSNPTDTDARAAALAAEETIVLAGARAYVDELVRFATGGEPQRFDDGAGAPLVEEAFERSKDGATSRSELGELTVVEQGVRRFIRGPLDGDSSKILRDLPRRGIEAVARALSDARENRGDAPSVESMRVLDAVQELGSGVASLPRIRVLALVEGETSSTDDDRVYELKELTDTPALGWRAPGRVADDVLARVRLSAATLWSRPDADPSWSTATLFSLPVQVRLETDAHRTLRVHRLTGVKATPEALEALAAVLGAKLAAIHWRSEGASAVASRLRHDPERASSSLATVARGYASTVLDDHERFRSALLDLGPTLGVRASDDEPLVSPLDELVEGR
ncbi:MAG: DUF2252 family protein [Deltaproteobacteria bacterium]|nr:DUF2252 family protein [Deltaproteobacteria bacterium]